MLIPFLAIVGGLAYLAHNDPSYKDARKRIMYMRSSRT